MKNQLTFFAKMALLPFLLFCTHNYVNAQEQLTVMGSVKDSHGAPLPGASIVIQGTQKGTTSDFDGNFQLDGVPANGQLVISYIGFEKLLIDIDNRTSIDIVLLENNNLLDEVVLIGYQSVKRSEIVGSVSVVETDDMLKAPGEMSVKCYRVGPLG